MLNFFKRPDIHAGLEEMEQNKNAVLLDVRTPEEYNKGHIEKAKNLPLDRALEIQQIIPNKDTPIFTYCLSGARSEEAAQFFRRIGYAHVQNIGGIAGYCGKLVLK